MRSLDSQFHCLEAKLSQDTLDQSVVCHINRSRSYLASISIFPYILDIHSVYLSITFYPPLHSLHSFYLYVCHILFISVHSTSCPSHILYAFYTSVHHILSISIHSIYSYFLTHSISIHSVFIFYICPPHSIIVCTFLILNIFPYHIFSFSVHSAHSFYTFVLYILSIFQCILHIYSISVHYILCIHGFIFSSMFFTFILWICP